MKTYLKRGIISFFISAFAGVVVNLLIDVSVNAGGAENFISMSPDFVKLFPTPVIAAYVNIFLYGLIGFTFSVMTFIYGVERMGLLFQSVIYFIVTAGVCLGITVIIWQLHRYPAAFVCTLCGYAATHVIMFIVGYKSLKQDVKEINELSADI
ncbi:MAG: DUF3021 domain-containing protein [Lachnospiraceae bacterium]|jgi:hypothetical protein|nr:DUF3021 domain-containing protein [Lachnospiraceae bacterium]